MNESAPTSSRAQNRNLPLMGKSRRRFNKRFKPNQSREDITHGPIYASNLESIILNESKHDWSETNPDGIVPVVINPKLVTNGKSEDDLKQTQVDGIRFLWDCFLERKGGILAHGTGTGKTRTGITLIATLLEQSSNSSGRSTPAITKCLVLAPKNAVPVWKEEFDTWTKGAVSVQSRTITSGQRDGWKVVNNFMSKESGAHILILSYDSFRKYSSNYEDGFAKKDESQTIVDIVICDEAHALKNPKTDRVEILSKFKSKAKIWFGFTATPFQNNLKELCNLVSFFRNDILDEIYNSRDNLPIMKKLMKAQELPQGSDERPLLKKVIDLIRPALHIKETILHIERNEVILCIPLDGHPDYSTQNDDDVTDPGIQHEMYKMIWTILKDNPKCVKSFVKLDILNKLCISPKLCVKAIRKHEAVFQTVISFYESNFHIDEPDELEGIYSSKASALIKMALAFEESNNSKEKEKNPEKMVIVSLSLELLAIVKEMFDEKKIHYVEYFGKTPEVVRLNNLQSFNTKNEIRFLLLSMKAGGTSLTLTRANHIVLMDPDYNPANDKQAFGRIYRHGQTRPVFVYRMLATGTIEEAKCLLQLSKEELEKCFTKEGDLRIGGQVTESNLFIYEDKTRSYVRDKLDSFDIEDFNNDVYDSTFSDQLRDAKRYSNNYEVPEALPLVKSIWEYVSFAFHIPFAPDGVMGEVVAEMVEGRSSQ